MACQLDYLCELPSDRAREKALDSLPPSLNETYERILKRVDQRGNYARLLVQRTLCWIISAREQLSIAGLQEALSVEEDQTALDPRNKPDIRTVLRYCSSLIRKSVDGDHLELAHFTVEEFLSSPLSDREGKANTESIAAKYCINPELSQRHLAEVCLSYLNCQDFNKLAETREEWEEHIARYPLRRHAVLYWSHYMRGAGEDEKAMRLAKRIFQPPQTLPFLSLSQDLVTLEDDDVTKAELEYGFSSSNFEDIRSAIASNGMSPLHLACISRATPLVHWLLECGCDPSQMSPLGSPLLCALLGRRSLDLLVYNYDVTKFCFEDAINSDALELARLLIKAGARVGDPCITGGRHPPNSHFSILSWDTHTQTVEVENAMPSLFRVLIGSNFENAGGFINLIEELSEAGEWPKVKSLIVLSRKSFSEKEQSQVIKVAALPRTSTCLRPLTEQNDGHELLKKSTVSVQVTGALLVAIRLDAVRELQAILQAHTFDLNSEIGGVSGREKRVPLHLAIESESLDCASVLLDWGVNVNALDSSGRSALHHCVSKVESAVALLLGMGARIDQVDASGSTIFHVAATANDVKILKTFLQAPTFDQRILARLCSDGLTPLLAAARAGSQDAFLLLIDFTENLNMQISPDGLSLAHYAAAFRPLILETLLKRGLDMTKTSRQGWTPLHCCCMKPNGSSTVKNVELLYENGIDPDVVDVEGETALSYLLGKGPSIAWEGIETLVRILGTPFNVTHKDKAGWTVLHSLLRYQQPYWNKTLVLNILFGYGADVTILGPDNQTCFDTLLSMDTDDDVSDIEIVHLDDRLWREDSISELLIELLSRLSPASDFVKYTLPTGKMLLWAVRACQDQLTTLLMERFSDIGIEMLEPIFLEDIPAYMIQTLLAHVDKSLLAKPSTKSRQNLLHTVCGENSQADAGFSPYLLPKVQIQMPQAS